MNPLVSICVPVYNVAPYIERCVRSLMEQAYDNIEYVFVNDCSTDNSLSLLQQMLDLYPRHRDNVKIISNRRNSGLAYTRRVSIENASGEYVMCVDSDDYIPLDAVQVLVHAALDKDADIVCGKAMFVKTDGSLSPIPAYIPSAEDYVKDALTDDFSHIWGKLYKRSLFAGDFSFAPDGMDYNEDRIVCLYMSYKAKSIVSIEDVVYNYVYRPNSVSAVRSEKQFECVIRYWQSAEHFLKAVGRYDEYKDFCDYKKVSDKADLLLYAADLAVRQRFAEIFPIETAKYKKQIQGGKRLMLELTSRHFWALVRCYQIYIDIYKRLHTKTHF